MSLRLKDVVKEYPDFKLKIDLRVNKGELVTILGPSGCGKTTTLRVIAGFITPDKGNIFVSDRLIDKLPPHKRQIGIVFQDYALFPNLNVLDNIAFGLKMQGVKRILREAKSRKLLKLVHLNDYGGRKISQLSGGEQQRVALARALATEPRLLLLDEPLSALDAKLRKGLRSEIRRIQRELAITTLYITHDQEEALALSDRIAVMHNGKIEQAGEPQEIYNEPVNLFVAGFVGQANFLKGTVRSIKGRYALFNTALGDIKAPASGGCYPGREMQLFFRPENCTIKSSTAAEKKGNYIRGMVAGCEYLGEIMQLEVVSRGSRFILRLRGCPPIAAGDPVVFSIKVDNCRLLPNSR
ncbi:Spermidine/putrescine import ATP-binding protein PotA [subsurface metagenome]